MPSPMDKVRRDVQVNIVDKLNTQVFYIGRYYSLPKS